jgi:hypothetical protein
MKRALWIWLLVLIGAVLLFAALWKAVTGLRL